MGGPGFERRVPMSPRRSLRCLASNGLAAAILAIVAAAAAADTFTVLNTDDTGAGSLRQAITDANALGGTNTIAFAIPGGGVHTIAVPNTALPSVTSPLVVDGTTQPGYSGSPLIELHGNLNNGL